MRLGSHDFFKHVADLQRVLVVAPVSETGLMSINTPSKLGIFAQSFAWSLFFRWLYKSISQGSPGFAKHINAVWISSGLRVSSCRETPGTVCKYTY